MSEEDDKRPDPRLTEEETLTIVRAKKPEPKGSEATTRRMVRDATLDAAIRGERPPAEDDDDWDEDIPEDIPELAGTAQLPAHIERRALPFRRRKDGGRQHDPSQEAPFTGGAAPTAAAWAGDPGDPSLDASQLPSALAPRDPSNAPLPARRGQPDADEGTLLGVAIVFGVFVVLALGLVAVAAFGV